MSIENQLPKIHNPANWQWADKNGKVYRLDTLSRDDLMQVACNCMQTLEDAESLAADMQELFNKWRTGGPAGSQADDSQEKR